MFGRDVQWPRPNGGQQEMRCSTMGGSGLEEGSSADRGWGCSGLEKPYANLTRAAHGGDGRDGDHTGCRGGGS